MIRRIAIVLAELGTKGAIYLRGLLTTGKAATTLLFK